MEVLGCAEGGRKGGSLVFFILFFCVLTERMDHRNKNICRALVLFLRRNYDLEQ